MRFWRRRPKPIKPRPCKGSTVCRSPRPPVAAARPADRTSSRPAFVDLVRMHQAAVRMYISSHVTDRTIADDIAQETFTAAFRSLGEFQGDSTLRTWLLGIARHRTLDECRRQMRATKRSALDRALRGRAIELLAADAAHVAATSLATSAACLRTALCVPASSPPMRTPPLLPCQPTHGMYKRPQTQRHRQTQVQIHSLE